MLVNYSRKSAKTGRLLASALADASSEYTLNWGASNLAQIEGRIINKASAIALAANKPQAILTMGTLAPNMWWPSEHITHYPVVGRPDYHSKGRHFYLCHNKMDVRRALRRKVPATHFLEFLDLPHEYRVHIINGKVIKLVEKTGGFGVIRNHRFGWYFGTPTVNQLDHVRNAAKEAVKRLGLDIGAADVMADEHRAFVLEVNTAPSLNDSSLATYVRHIKTIWGGSSVVRAHVL